MPSNLDFDEKQEMVNIDYDELKHETAKAWLIVVGDEEYWMPKSTCEMCDEVTIDVPVWLAEIKGLV